MCGRYTLTYSDLSAIVAELDALLDPAAAELYRPRYNVAPTNAVVIARPGPDRPVLVPAVWGLQRDRRLIINARSEGAASRFPAAYQHGRCVVPADGFYEWTGELRERRPIWFHAAGHDGSRPQTAGHDGGSRPQTAGHDGGSRPQTAGHDGGSRPQTAGHDGGSRPQTAGHDGGSRPQTPGAPLLMAGLFDERPGAPLAFAILTAAARPPVAAIHDRMPVLLSREGARRWLLGDPPRVVQPDDVPLAARPVSPRANATAHDDPACLEPAGELPGKQLGLF